MQQFDLPSHRLLSRADLHLLGMGDKPIRRLVRTGSLLRVRRGLYLRGDCDPVIVGASRAGGRLACVSALSWSGVFVQGGSASTRDGIHAHVPSHGSRFDAATARLHWAPLSRQPHPTDPVVDVVDALAQSSACQTARAFIASVDSALHLRQLHPDDLDDVFAALPRRLRRLRGLVDGRAESGTETLVRLMLRGLGVSAELQVWFEGVGRVDLLVEDWLVIECDSRAHHGSWADVRRDRRRDQTLAALGYVVYRPIAEDILFDPEAVLRALKGLIAARRSWASGRSGNGSEGAHAG